MINEIDMRKNMIDIYTIFKNERINIYQLRVHQIVRGNVSTSSFIRHMNTNYEDLKKMVPENCVLIDFVQGKAEIRP